MHIGFLDGEAFKEAFSKDWCYHILGYDYNDHFLCQQFSSHYYYEKNFSEVREGVIKHRISFPALGAPFCLVFPWSGYCSLRRMMLCDLAHAEDDILVLKDSRKAERPGKASVPIFSSSDTQPYLIFTQKLLSSINMSSPKSNLNTDLKKNIYLEMQHRGCLKILATGLLIRN